MTPTFLPSHQRNYGFDLVEPKHWPSDGGERREPVLDPNFEPPRTVRLVGWRPCMCCGKSFWSEDVKRQRLHPDGCSVVSPI